MLADDTRKWPPQDKPPPKGTYGRKHWRADRDAFHAGARTQANRDFFTEWSESSDGGKRRTKRKHPLAVLRAALEYLNKLKIRDKGAHYYFATKDIIAGVDFDDGVGLQAGLAHEITQRES